MKKIAGLLWVLCLSFTSFCQTITYEDFKGMLPLLEKEDYKEIFKQSRDLLAHTLDDDSGLRGIVTYMNIYAAAGMVTKDEMSYDDFARNVGQFKGKLVVMSGHPCIAADAKGYNSLQFVSKDDQTLGLTITSNKAKSNILCFEYFKYKEPVTAADFVGKTVRCSGILESIDVNPNKSKIWVARLHVTNAETHVMEP